MNGLLLFIYTSFIVIFQINAFAVDADKYNDYIELCALCNEASLLPCSYKEISRFEKRLYCSQFNCTLAIFSNNGTEDVCLIDNSSISAEIPSELTNDLLQSMQSSEMLPSAMALQSNATESVEQNEVQSEAIEEPALVASIHESHVDEAVEHSEDPQNVMGNAADSTPESKPEPKPETQQESETINEVDDVTSTSKEAASVVQTEQASDVDNDAKPMEEVPDAAVGSVDNSTNLLENTAVNTNNMQADASDASHVNVPEYVADAPIDTEITNPDITIQPVKLDQQEIAATETEDKNESNHENELTPTMEDATKPPVNSSAVDNQAAGKDTSNVLQMPTSVTVAQFQSCYACSSSDEPLCISKPSKEINCKTVEGKQNGCYTLHKDVELKRGCLSELAPLELAACLADDDKSCLACHSNNCNGALWPQCYTCSSSETAPTCAWWSYTSADALQLAQTCHNYSDLCIVYIDATGATERRCAAKELAATCDVGGSKCHVCADQLCNGGVFPKTRRRCQQCAGSSACADAQNLTEAQPCAIYQSDDTDGCFLYVNAAGEMQRGCTTATAQYDRCRASGTTKCRTCIGKDACNSLPLMLTPTLSCSRCDSRLSDGRAESDTVPSANCAWAQSSESVSVCSNRYLYYLEQSCQTVYQPDVELAVRGCTLDIGACEPTNQWCETCNTDACNTGNLRWEYCVQCSSEQVTSCAIDAAHIAASKCTEAVQPYELRGCYTRLDVDTNTTTRGCISDLTEEGMKYCKTKKKLCNLCYDTGCNNRLAPSVATRHQFSIAIIALLMLLRVSL